MILYYPERLKTYRLGVRPARMILNYIYWASLQMSVMAVGRRETFWSIKYRIEADFFFKIQNTVGTTTQWQAALLSKGAQKIIQINFPLDTVELHLTFRFFEKVYTFYALYILHSCLIRARDPFWRRITNRRTILGEKVKSSRKTWRRRMAETWVF